MADRHAVPEEETIATSAPVSTEATMPSAGETLGNAPTLRALEDPPTRPADQGDATTLHAAQEAATIDVRASGPDTLSNSAPTIDAAANFGATVEHDSGLGSAVGDTVAHVSGSSTPLATALDSAQSRLKGRKAAQGFGNIKIPNYHIVGELGRGGMGVVYEAEHVLLNRKVALKVILAGQHAGDDQIERFLTEAQAVAQLRHPGIVQIFDIGESEGIPFFSLEFIDGGALDKRIAGSPQDPKWSARITEQLARAMQVAHENGIIHRDLKPANILLTKQGQPKITDFGLAKKLETDSQQTRSGSIMGTPTYMAPEQAWGKIKELGPHSDIYSLGSILYALLTGRPPFQGTSLMEILEQVRTREPVPPSQLQPRLPGDLETICLKCLQKEPERRYGTSRELADDLQRFLDGVPIEARPVSAPERAWRWCRRNPKYAGLLATIAVLLLSGITGLAIAASVLRDRNERLGDSLQAQERATARATAKEHEATVAQKLAESKTQEAKESVKKALEQNKGAIDAWRSFGKIAYQDLAPIPGTAEIRLRLLDQVQKGLTESIKGMLPLYEVTRDESNPQLVDHALAGAYKQVGEAFVQMGRVREAGEQFEHMDRIYEALYQANPNAPHYWMTMAQGKGALGTFSLYSLGDAEGAERSYQAAYDLHRKRQERMPDDGQVRRDVANALGGMAATSLALGRIDQAIERYTEEVALRESFPDWLEADLEVQRELSGLHEKLGQLSLSRERKDEAREHYRKSLAIREAVARARPDNVPNLRDIHRSQQDFGHIALLEMNDPETALDYYKRALEGMKELVVRDPESAVFKGDLGTAYYFVATALLRLNRMDESRSVYGQCLELRQQLASDAKIPESDLMLALARCGEHAEAARIARKLLELPPQNAVFSIESACGLAIAAGAVDDDALRRTYTDEAVASIRHEIARGWRDLGRLKIDPDLDSIRSDPGFQALITELEGLAGSGK